MDLHGLLKSRVAEALVEGIFRRAGYHVGLVGRDARVQRQLEVGPHEFVPDLLVWKQSPGHDGDGPIALEIKYRGDVERWLPRDVEQVASATRRWPDLYLVYVTDRPAPGRSCFQALDVAHCRPDVAWATSDLHETSGLGIWWRSVQEHEALVQALFPVLSGDLHRGRSGPAGPAAGDRVPVATTG